LLKVNRAAEEGPGKFPWWKDWRGETVAIVASGPSVKKKEIELLRGRVKLIAIKQNYDLAPWCDVVYGCDAPWWKYRHGLPEFKGLKLCYDRRAADQFKDVHAIEIDRKQHHILTDKAGTIGSAGNSGHQALNLAVQFGAKRILGLGYDSQDKNGTHWYGRNNWADANNPDESNFRMWRRHMEQAAADLQLLGVEFVNCSAVSTVNNFRRATVAAMIEEWALDAAEADPVRP
jgi:hypothetical protein